MTHTIEAVPQQTPPTPDAQPVQPGISRRQFLQLSALGTGAGLLAACAPPSPGETAVISTTAGVAAANGPEIYEGFSTWMNQHLRQPETQPDTETLSYKPTIADIFSGKAEIPQDPGEAFRFGANATLESLRHYNQKYGLGADIPAEAEFLSDPEYAKHLDAEAAKRKHEDRLVLYYPADPILSTRRDGEEYSARLVINRDIGDASAADPKSVAMWAIDATMQAVLYVQPPHRTQDVPFAIQSDGQAGPRQADWAWGWSMGGENASGEAWENQGFAGAVTRLASVHLLSQEGLRAGLPQENIDAAHAQAAQTSQLHHLIRFTDACGIDPIDLWKAGKESDFGEAYRFLEEHHARTFPNFPDRQEHLLLYILSPDEMSDVGRDFLTRWILPTKDSNPDTTSEERPPIVQPLFPTQPEIDAGTIEMDIDPTIPRRPIS